ncbi:flagellar assembly protein FliH [Pseudomonas sp. SLBN-26]|uniref:flagellar assembly protein FliH n=1 Tax=Pseudomonadaceae TaxID=135621 RepID=UPI0011542ACA|nr:MULTISPECIES: flagellar assembly protein FliH [Pseudomonas]MCP1615952.1 flagellar assembly protein FliH [Pseudomonas otitidis]TQL05219.1 flagellar assembly protein FliH [Pseudomonas sp. SLBN-26]
MNSRVIKGDSAGWRPYRFPPRSRLAGVIGEREAGLGGQAGLSNGYQAAVEQGYQEGCEQGRAAGHAEGVAQGLAEGRRQAREEIRVAAQQRFEEASAPLQQLIEAHRTLNRDLERRRREELLELVRKVAQQVIRCELTLSPMQLLSLADEALAGLPGDLGEVELRLNPEECARLRDLAPERTAAWRLVPDECLGQGECRLVTAQAEADIGCQQRLEACLETLSDHLIKEH